MVRVVDVTPIRLIGVFIAVEAVLALFVVPYPS